MLSPPFQFPSAEHCQERRGRTDCRPHPDWYIVYIITPHINPHLIDRLILFIVKAHHKRRPGDSFLGRVLRE